MAAAATTTITVAPTVHALPTGFGECVGIRVQVDDTINFLFEEATIKQNVLTITDVNGEVIKQYTLDGGSLYKYHFAADNRLLCLAAGKFVTFCHNDAVVKFDVKNACGVHIGEDHNLYVLAYSYEGNHVSSTCYLQVSAFTPRGEPVWDSSVVISSCQRTMKILGLHQGALIVSADDRIFEAVPNGEMKLIKSLGQKDELKYLCLTPSGTFVRSLYTEDVEVFNVFRLNDNGTTDNICQYKLDSAKPFAHSKTWVATDTKLVSIDATSTRYMVMNR